MTDNLTPMTGPLKPWNGKDAHGQYQYSLEQISEWNMQIDEKGAIWYTTKEQPPRLNIWSPAFCLSSHLHHLSNTCPFICG